MNLVRAPVLEGKVHSADSQNEKMKGALGRAGIRYSVAEGRIEHQERHKHRPSTRRSDDRHGNFTACGLPQNLHFHTALPTLEGLWVYGTPAPLRQEC